MTRPGISEAVLRAAGVECVDALEAERRCGLAATGLFIPYRTIDGADVIDANRPYGRLRLDQPTGDKKYHQAVGSSVHAYVPPGLDKVAPGGDLHLIEGEFKALSLTEAGFPAVGVSGFYGYARKGGVEPVAELAEVVARLQPQRIFFCGDSDTALNHQFAIAAVRLAQLLRPLPVLLPRIPYEGPGKGADDCRDVLKAEFTSWWQNLLTTAVPVAAESDASVLAFALFERETDGLAKMEGPEQHRAEQRLVKLAAGLGRDALLQDRVVRFAERQFKVRRATFMRAVERVRKAGLHDREPDELHVYYDPGRKCYWLSNDRGEMIEINESSLVKHLRAAGYDAGDGEEKGLSAVDLRIIEIQRTLDVVYAGPLAGQSVGLQEMCGHRVLVTRSPRLPQPKVGECPHIEQLILGLLGDGKHNQVPYFLGWLKIAYEALAAGQLRHGQMLAIAGPRDCGKSLLQNLITEVLGGRVAKPYRYMCGATDFNGDLFTAEHLMIEDEVSFTDIRARRHFGARIKDFTVNTVQSCHAKNRQAISLKPFWRVTISLNDEPENLLILPPIDESLEDKVILLKATKADMPVDTSTADGYREFMELLLSEVPAFVHHLTRFEIPEALVSKRFGVTHFHHPDLITALEDMSPEMRLLALIDSAMEEDDKLGPWTGTAAELERRLADSPFKDEARRLLDWNNAAGTYLGRLARRCGDRVQQQRTEHRRGWIIYPADWVSLEQDHDKADTRLTPSI
ncbi:DUF3854 domain-containing protein [bacterium]|nr:DUF3854 domain-containing protein [bacterium]